MNPLNRTQASAACSSGVFHYSLTSHAVAACFHSYMCSKVHSCWHKEDVMLDPAPLIFSRLEWLTLHMRVSRSSGVRSCFSCGRAVLLRLMVVSINFYLIISLCGCTRQLCLCLRHIQNLRLHSFMQLLCIHFVDIKMPQSCTPLNRRGIV